MKKRINYKNKNLTGFLFGMCLSLIIFGQTQMVFSQIYADEEKDGVKLSDVRSIYESGEAGNSPVGFWQHPSKAVWVHINEKQEAFQCRIGKDNLIYMSLGTLEAGRKITWNKFWKTDQIDVKNNEINLKGKDEKISLVRVENIYEPNCRSLIEPYGSLEDPYGTPKYETLNDGGFGPGKGQGLGTGSGRGSGGGMGSGEGRGSGIGTGNSDKTNKTPVKNSKMTRGIRILSKPKPSYTDEARQNGVQGIVDLRVTFLANGTIGDINPVTELPYGLTEKAIVAARNIQFEPEMKNGKPTTVVKTLRYNFSVY